MKHQLILAGMLLAGAQSVLAQSYFDDDIYYNPSKKTETSSTKKQKKQSNYIANFGDIDVDAYNRRDQYYVSSPIDTIGSYVENGEDFVYTQEIQKYYNPTIVVDNADVLGDVLANSYGNVEIVIDNNGLPIFTPYYAYGWPAYRYGWPYYGGWGLNIGGWGWNFSFYDPWYSWNWGYGPGWGFGPGWGWGYGPGWGYGYHHPPMANWRPNGNRPVGPGNGWTAGNHRPGGANLNHASASRPGVASRPQATHRPTPGNSVRPTTVSRPGGNGVVNNNGRWEYVNGGHRVPAGASNGSSGNGTTRPSGNGNTRPAVTDRSEIRRGSSAQKTQSTTIANPTNRNNSSTNRSTNNSNNNRSYNNTNRSYNSGGSSNRGGFSGGGRSSGGARSTGGGGRHR